MKKEGKGKTGSHRGLWGRLTLEKQHMLTLKIYAYVYLGKPSCNHSKTYVPEMKTFSQNTAAHLI